MWDLIVSVPDHCLSFYYESRRAGKAMKKPVISGLNPEIWQACCAESFQVDVYHCQ